MSTVTDYIVEFTGKQKQTFEFLHKFILSFPGIHDKIRYNIPFYYRKTWICYLNPLKSGGVELAFTRANELTDVNHLLEFNGRKQVAGIAYHDPSEIDENFLRLIINEALILDEEIPYRVKRDNNK